MWKTVIVNSGEKMYTRNNWLVISMPDGYEKKVPVSDLYSVVIDNHNMSISVPVLEALSENNVHLIIDSRKHMPVAQLFPMNTNYKAAHVLHKQIDMTEEFRGDIWKRIIQSKIQNQITVLDYIFADEDVISKMKTMKNAVASDDCTNREAIAARMFFREIHGKHFIRFHEDTKNAALNYGYTILRTAISKSLTSHGFNCVLGIHHKSERNEFNLADDFIEPLRPLVDKWVYDNECMLTDGITSEVKRELINLLNSTIMIKGEHTQVRYAIDKMIMSFGRSLENNRPESLLLPELICEVE